MENDSVPSTTSDSLMISIDNPSTSAYVDEEQEQLSQPNSYSVHSNTTMAKSKSKRETACCSLKILEMHVTDTSGADEGITNNDTDYENDNDDDADSCCHNRIVGIITQQKDSKIHRVISVF
jgi:hypothetical protein